MITNVFGSSFISSSLRQVHQLWSIDLVVANTAITERVAASDVELLRNTGWVLRGSQWG